MSITAVGKLTHDMPILQVLDNISFMKYNKVTILQLFQIIALYRINQLTVDLPVGINKITMLH